MTHYIIVVYDMDDNGYIRKIDELGRIVIPKELRQKLKIQDGENLIINYIDKKINLSKYSYIGNNIEFIKKVGDKLNFLMDIDVIITDIEKIIYSNLNLTEKNMDKSLIEYIINRKSKEINNLNVNNDTKLTGNIYIEPIISNSLGIGLVIFNTKQSNDFNVNLCKLISEIISYHINIT